MFKYFGFSRMAREQKFQQKWQFKKRDNDRLRNQIGFPSEEWESSSSATLVFKKQKLDLEGCDFNSFQSEERDFPPKFEITKKILGKNEENDLGISKFNKESLEKMGNRDSGTKNKDTHIPVTLETTRILMESILAELEIARENLFVWMREEMQKVVGDCSSKRTSKEGGFEHEKIESQHQNGTKLQTVAGICDPRPLGSVVKRVLDSQTDNEVVGSSFGSKKSQFDYCHIKEVSGIAVPESDPEGLQSVLQEPNFSVNPNHVSAAVKLNYLNRATGLPEISFENQKLGSIPCNLFVSGGGQNMNAVDIRRSNPIVHLNIHPGRFSQGPHEENFENIVRSSVWNSEIESQRQGLTYNFQNKLTCSSDLETGFPIPIRNSLDSGVEIQSQVGVQNLTQVPNFFGSSMVSNGSSEFYIGNLLCNNLNFKHSNAQIPRHLNAISQSGALLRELDTLELNT